MTTKVVPNQTQTIQKGHGPCPDCGSGDASVKTITPHDYNGNTLDHYWLVINCPHCNYYEFTYHGPN